MSSFPFPLFDSMAMVNDTLYVTKGHLYVRYSKPLTGQVDDGFPRALNNGAWGFLSEPFASGFDSMTVINGKLYVTKGSYYLRYSDPNVGSVDPGYPMFFGSNWGSLPPGFLQNFDTMAVINGSLYVTHGNYYLRYSDPAWSVIDQGYPKPLWGNWGDLDSDFSSGFDSMAVLPDGRLYVTKGKRYLRYSDPKKGQIDTDYPRSIEGFWGDVSLSTDTRNEKQVWLVDVWGEGRIVDRNLISGFKEAYNINRPGQTISNGPDRGQPIPNHITVDQNYPTFPFQDGVVEYLTVMGSPINARTAQEMLRVLHPQRGVVIMWAISDDQRRTFEQNMGRLIDKTGTARLGWPFDEITIGTRHVYGFRGVRDRYDL